jgi:glycosyltransferase involved in cell wall biosynthesis
VTDSSSRPKPLVSVLTPSIPERAGFLDECVASVKAQTVTGIEHLVKVDGQRNGCSITMNELALEAQGEWLLPLADDDLLLPRCVETLLSYADQGDIIYAPPLVWGQPQEWFTQAPPVIPSFALIRRDVWFELDGYDETAVREEDRKMWIKALEHGFRFVRADSAPTWVYRLAHGGNKSFNNGVASGPMLVAA